MRDKLIPENGCLVQLNVDSMNRDNRCDLQGSYEVNERVFGIFFKYHSLDRSEWQIFHINKRGSVNLMRIKAEHCDVITPSIYSSEFINRFNGSNIINEELCKFGKPENIYPPFRRLKHEVIQEMTEDEIISKIGISKLQEHIVRCLMALDSAEERLQQIKNFNENIPSNNRQSPERLEKMVIDASSLSRRGAKTVNGRNIKEVLTAIDRDYTTTTNITEQPLSFNEFVAAIPPTKRD